MKRGECGPVITVEPVSQTDRDELVKFEQWSTLVAAGVSQRDAYVQVYGEIIFERKPPEGGAR